MGLTAGTPLREIKVDTVFLGSCTNGRIEDLRVAAELLRGKHIDPDTRMLVVPGSVAVKAQAEAEGLDRVFLDAGAEWRGAGCSMCLGMNPDQLKPGERSASTSNRNFQGRQGKGGRTHLVSPSVAAATALTGKLTAPADLETLESDRDGRLHHPHRHRRPAAPHRTSTPTRSSRPSTSSGSPAPASRTACSRPGAPTSRTSCSTSRSTPAPRSSWPGRTSAPAPRASTPCWALLDGGFRVVISSRFADIFRNNSTKAGLLTVLLPQADVEALWAAVEADPTTAGDRRPAGRAGRPTATSTVPFEIDDYTRWRLLEGLDDVGLTERQPGRHRGVRGARRPAFLPKALPVL